MAAHEPRVQQPQDSQWDRILGFIAQYSVHLVLTTFALLTLLPMLLTVSASFTDEVSLTKDGYALIPRVFSLDGYRLIAKEPTQLIRSYELTFLVTIVGTIIGLAMMTLIAYPLSRSEYSLRRPLSVIVFFVLIFSGGIVPFYILVTQYLQMRNTVAVLIVPMLVRVYFVLILRTYLADLPTELIDAARVDGAGEWRIFSAIVLPLAKPALATIGLFTALDYWNNWTSGLYFITDSKLYTLNYMLYQIMRNAQELALEPHMVGIESMPLQSTRMAMAVLATGPAALAFLIFQKYLVRGVTLGSFK